LTAQSSKAESQKSSNPLVGVGSGLIETLNGGNPAEQQRFLASNLYDNALKEWQASERDVPLQRASDLML